MQILDDKFQQVQKREKGEGTKEQPQQEEKEILVCMFHPNSKGAEV